MFQLQSESSPKRGLLAIRLEGRLSYHETTPVQAAPVEEVRGHWILVEAKNKIDYFHVLERESFAYWFTCLSRGSYMYGHLLLHDTSKSKTKKGSNQIGKKRSFTKLKVVESILLAKISIIWTVAIRCPICLSYSILYSRRKRKKTFEICSAQ